jgi:hypothetical protein
VVRGGRFNCSIYGGMVDSDDGEVRRRTCTVEDHRSEEEGMQDTMVGSAESQLASERAPVIRPSAGRLESTATLLTPSS